MTTSMEYMDSRAKFGFPNLVMQNFAFLFELGFVEAKSLSTLVLYRKGDLEVDVYHGRKSYEIGFGISHEGVRYSLGECIRVGDPEFGKQYRVFAATTQGALERGLVQTAELVKTYCKPALLGDASFFNILDSQGKLWSQNYALEVMVYQLRPKAHEAFRLGKYRLAAELYKSFESCLSPVEVKKLAYAEKNSGKA